MPAALKDFHVGVDTDLELGVFANAFRVIEEAGPDCFLDFLLYSAQEQKAQVVSRVRVRRAFLPAIREIMAEFSEDLPTISEESTADTGKFVFMGESDDPTTN